MCGGRGGTPCRPGPRRRRRLRGASCRQHRDGAGVATLTHHPSPAWIVGDGVPGTRQGSTEAAPPESLPHIDRSSSGSSTPPVVDPYSIRADHPSRRPGSFSDTTRSFGRRPGQPSGLVGGGNGHPDPDPCPAREHRGDPAGRAPDLIRLSAHACGALPSAVRSAPLHNCGPPGVGEDLRGRVGDHPADAATASISSNHLSSKIPVMIVVRATRRPSRTSSRTRR